MYCKFFSFLAYSAFDFIPRLALMILKSSFATEDIWCNIYLQLPTANDAQVDNTKGTFDFRLRNV